MVTELDIKGSEAFAQYLRLVDVPEVVAPPNKEQHFHVEDDEEDDVGQGGHYKEQISRLTSIKGTYEPIMYWMWSIVCEKS